MRPDWTSERNVRASVVAVAIMALLCVAGAEPESVGIDYVAPPDCPDSTEFMRSLRERTTRFREAGPNEPVRQFLVSITADGPSFVGRFEIRGPDGSVAAREVDASDCAEVSGAVALMVALAIDPSALTMSPKSEVPSSVEGEPTPAVESRPRRESPAPVAVVVRPPRSVHDGLEAWGWSLGSIGHMAFLLSPSFGYGGALFVDTEAPESSALGPAARVGILLNQSDVNSSTGADARFLWTLAVVEGCPVRIAVILPRSTLHPCLALRVGMLRGEARDISQPKAARSAWLDAGPVLRLRVAVTPALYLEAESAFVFPLHRTTFEILDTGSAATVYSVPSLGVLAGGGISFRFR